MTELEHSLRQRLAPGSGFVPSSAGFVFWAAEHIRSRFGGGQLTWDFVFRGLGLTPDRAAAVGWVGDGMKFWRRSIRRYRGGQRMFLDSLLAEGGLPESLLQHEGLYRRVVLGILKDIEAEGGSRAEPLAVRIAERWVAVLPQAFQPFEFAQILAIFAMALVKLREQLPDDWPEEAADRWLDENRPDWKSDLPLRLSDSILNELVRPALRTRRTGGTAGGPFATRELQRDEAGIWHAVVRLAEEGFLPEALLPSAAGLRFRLMAAGAAADVAGTLTYAAAPDAGGWHVRRFGRAGPATLRLSLDVPLLLGAFADGLRQGEIVAAPELPPPVDAPSLWRAADPAEGEAAARLVPQSGSGRARATCLWLLTAQSVIPEPDGTLTVERAGTIADGQLWRLTGRGRLLLGPAHILRIETSAETEAGEAQLIAAGPTLLRWRTRREKGIIYRGSPAIFGAIGAAGLTQLRGQSLRIIPSRSRVLGGQMAEWVEQSDVLARLRFICLPATARLSATEEGAGRVRVEAYAFPAGLRLSMRAGSAETDVLLPDGAGRATLAIDGVPPGELTVRLSEPGMGLALELVAPWPARDGMILQPDGERLDRETPLAADELLGWRALIPDSSKGELELQLTAFKTAFKPVAIPVAGEVSLYPFAPLVRAMLAHGGPDSQVNLRLCVSGRGSPRIALRRYADNAVVEGDRLRVGLPRDTKPPPYNALSEQLDRGQIDLHAVSLANPEVRVGVKHTSERDLRTLLGGHDGPWLVQTKLDRRPQRAVLWSALPIPPSTRDARIMDFARAWQRLMQTPNDDAWQRNWSLVTNLAQAGDPGFADQVQSLGHVPEAAVALLLRVPATAVGEALALDMAAPIFWPTVPISGFAAAISVELQHSEARYATVFDSAEAVTEARNHLVRRIMEVLLLQPALAGHFAAALAQADLLSLALDLNARGPARLFIGNPDAELMELAQTAARRFDHLPSGISRISPRAPLRGTAFDSDAQSLIDAPLVAAEFALGLRGSALTPELLDLINLRLADPLYFDAALPVAVNRVFKEVRR